MKKATILLIFCTLMFSVILPLKEAKACIPPDSIVNIIVKYDTIPTVPCPTIEEVEIRLTNLRLMNEAPNKICNCALTSVADLFTNLKYVAFVDSGTNNPYQKFAAWNSNGTAAAAWNAANPRANGWSSFISNVINSGLSADDPVEMVIRATLPANVTLYADSFCATTGLDQMIRQSELGTDEWDAANNTIKGAHQGIRSFDYTKEPSSSISYVNEPKSYFVQLDNDILNNIPSGISSVTVFKNEVKLFPNPVSDKLNITYLSSSNAPLSIEVYNTLGKQSAIINVSDAKLGQNNFELDLQKYQLKSGIYFVSIKQGDAIITKRIVME